MDYLNDDCLCLIFGQLSLKQQLTMTKVCIRFHELVTNVVWNANYRQIYTERPTITDGVSTSLAKAQYAYDKVATLNKDSYQEFYALNVHNVEKLSVGNISRQAFCTYLGRHIQRPEFTFYFSFNYIRLIELSCLDSNVHDGHMRMIAEYCPALEIVMVRSAYVTGKHLKNLKNLRRLNVSHCSMKCLHLDEILDQLQNLKSLDVSSNHDLEIQSVIRWGQSLRELRIGEYEFIKQFQESAELSNLLRSLEKLEIMSLGNSDFEESKEMWMKFLKKVHLNVKILKITHMSSDFMGALAEIEDDENLQTFPRLEELHLEEQSAGAWLKTVVDCTTLRSLYLYEIAFLDEILGLIRNNPKLKLIYIKDSNFHRNLHKFRENVQHLMDAQPYHADVLLHFEIFGELGSHDLGESRTAIETYESQYGSRLNVRKTTKLGIQEKERGSLVLEMHAQ